jgi:Phage integrase family
MDRVIGVRTPGQCGGHIVHFQGGELVRHTVPVFNMATTHDTDDQRPPPIAARPGDRLGHCAVPELLRADETFEPFRCCAGVLEKYGERDWLGSATASQAALFRSQKGGAMTAGSMARFLKVLYAEAGISGATSHSGRRTLITRLAERGIDLKSIAEIAGHASIRTTTMYIEANPKRLARILQEVTF